MIGISPGTRSIGTAIFKEGELKDWGTKIFKEKWSATKLARILNNIEACIKMYNISCIIIKCPHGSRTSEGLDEVTKGIIIIAKRLRIPYKQYSIEELKYLCNGANTKQSLMNFVLSHYPEVGKTIKPSKRNKKYHMKTIESVALVHVRNQ
mgnify:CR=1 FL=1